VSSRITFVFLLPRRERHQSAENGTRGPFHRAGNDIDRHASQAHFNDLLISFTCEPAHDVIAPCRDCSQLDSALHTSFRIINRVSQAYQEMAPWRHLVTFSPSSFSVILCGGSCGGSLLPVSSIQVRRLDMHNVVVAMSEPEADAGRGGEVVLGQTVVEAAIHFRVSIFSHVVHQWTIVATRRASDQKWPDHRGDTGIPRWAAN
jgi:hypothetical protein